MAQMKNDVNRNIGIDLLRVVSMIMVVFLHVLGRGGILENAPFLSANYEVAWLIEIAAYCAVNCYALISGYVGIHGRYRYSNLVLLWLRVFFYTFFITAVFAIGTTGKVGKTGALAAFFPISTEQYWYFTAYAGMFLFIPLLNFFINHVSRKQLGAVVCGVMIFFSVMPTLFQRDIFVLKDGYSAFWMIILYLIGGYIGKYRIGNRRKISHLVILYLGCVGVTWLCKLMIEAGKYRFYGETTQTEFLVNYTSPTILMAAIALLLLFSKVNVTPSWEKIVKFFAPLSFSVYLIHFHPLVKCYVLAGRFAKVAQFPVAGMVFTIIVIVMGIFFGCAFLDWIREYIFKKAGIRNKLVKIEERFFGNLWNIQADNGKKEKV